MKKVRSGLIILLLGVLLVSNTYADEEDFGGKGSGEHDSESGHERVGEGSELNENAMSSPIIPLGQNWNGIIGGMSISASYDDRTKSISTTVKNTLSQKLCFVQVEPHLKKGTKTVGELGPGKLGDLDSRQQGTSKLNVVSEPELGNVVYDGYVIHMETFACGGPGPIPHSGEGREGSGEHGSESGSEGSGESHGSGDRD